MRISRTAFSLATAALIVSAPVAFAQNRDTGNAGEAATGTSSSMSAMPPSQQTTMGRSNSTSKMTGTDSGTGTTKGTATGGPVGGNPNRN
ncbi:hypothetical protein [Beijerinckia sp. L45]|uniref:hypothetical protein n=1 Tax=Beijerinckia sp. L45 TaxID=1641855 RepID=UPI00131C1DB5|nr:hypothetical protein [Beijerinckia sp. L45]